MFLLQQQGHVTIWQQVSGKSLGLWCSAAGRAETVLPLSPKWQAGRHAGRREGDRLWMTYVGLEEVKAPPQAPNRRRPPCGSRSSEAVSVRTVRHSAGSFSACLWRSKSRLCKIWSPRWDQANILQGRSELLIMWQKESCPVLERETYFKHSRTVQVVSPANPRFTNWKKIIYLNRLWTNGFFLWQFFFLSTFQIHTWFRLCRC